MNFFHLFVTRWSHFELYLLSPLMTITWELVKKFIWLCSWVHDHLSLYSFGYFVIASEVIHWHFVCFSSTAGILQREQEQSVVYGSIDSGKNISSHEKFLELVSYIECLHEYVFQGYYCVSHWLTVPCFLLALQGWQIYKNKTTQVSY